MIEPYPLSRRSVLVQVAASFAFLATRPAFAEADETAQAIREFTGGAKITPGKVSIEVAPLVENGNSVALAVAVESPMTVDHHVKTIALFNEKNPQPQIARFHLSPRSGTSRVETRIRLATTQHITAIAQLSDGSFWSQEVEVIVTIAACTEE
ncbi:MAG: sulfur oxidation protein SoxY [Rhizobiales bacterium PAR1]|nr:MAG: sulfur oxidation protein SoxY [Rhizobiales bacterium PAR1]